MDINRTILKNEFQRLFFEISNSDMDIFNRTSALIKLCKSNNINTLKCNSGDEMVIALWEKRIDVGDLGFGEPYDKMLSGWAQQEDEETGEPKYNLDTNMLFQAFIHVDTIPAFLCNSLDLPNELVKFNSIWTQLGYQPINNYDELKDILRTLTKIELCCLLFECENYFIYKDKYSIWTLLDRFMK